MTRQVRLLTLSALMCALIIVSTLWLKFTIPGTDVMFSSQVFFVLLCGLLLPPRYCFYTLGAYLLLGLAGLPVFTATVGLAVIATPSFGYLIAFPFEAAVTSAAAGRLVNQKGGRYISVLIGVAVSYVIALPYVALLKGVYLNAPVSLGVLLSAYCFAFLPLDIVKALLAAALAGRLEKPLGLTKSR